ncbi:sialate O-acetylesterase [Paraprevotella xylaniphila]|uniref:sialate O-acetylesterase n=1 Tax=Paraprevotella xylaniphila TaxID=454155 RepID=UPI0023F50CA0|nr:sialate O-acetylesterase [Paraprevotella xylaniphila]
MKIKNITRDMSFCAVLACASLQTPVMAKVTLPAFFTSNMIIQQKTTMTLFGKAKANKKVSVETSWNNQHYEAQADAKGNWRIEIATPAAGGPYRITLSDGKKTVLDNVMAGEVWFCSGQSNMEMPLAGWGKIKNYEQEIAAADYPGIRLFQVKKHTSVAPLDAYQVESTMGGWKECSPSTVPEFSAVAYLYARELHRKLNVPVGVIDCTWGGTPAEAWTSSESLKQVMGYQKKVGQLEALGFDRDKIMAEYGKEQAQWKAELSKVDKGFQNGKECWIGSDLDDNDWQQMELPGYWEGKGLPNFDGVVWFRKQIDIPSEWTGKDLQLNPGIIDDEDIIYWNGEQIANGAGYNVQRHYTVPGRLVKAGKNTLAIKVNDNGGEGGIAGKAEDMNLKLSDKDMLSLAGNWKYRVGCSLADMPPAPIYPEHSSFPSVLFNGMVHPCLEYPIKGVIWYQGCNNVGRAEEYESLFQTLITDWRKQFGQPDMPFYFVQLANYLDRKLVQADSPWAALREAQSKAQHLAHTGMAGNIDIGEAHDIHPKNKQEVARRLAAISLADTYGQKIPAQAPVYDNYTVGSDGKVRISFTIPAIGERFEQNKDIKGFTIAGPDHVFYPAEAYTDGDDVVVYSHYVKVPVAVRYGWADNPECTLRTPGNFPVAPFRTDNW